ncbi:hypothetical protein RB195_006760 [Necator americanus]|uniref:Uncharacterized protein n=1 Tax=Necator americanus TaxID=51031 RepID=A0ABR1BXF1_NECAM
MTDTADVDAAPYRVAILLFAAPHEQFDRCWKESPHFVDGAPLRSQLIRGNLLFRRDLATRLLCREPDPHLAQANQCFK